MEFNIDRFHKYDNINQLYHIYGSDGMSRIVIISLYDEFCLGPRYITSLLQTEGHQAELVLFKHCHAAYETPKEKRDPRDYLEHFYAGIHEIRLLQNFIKEREPLWVGFSFMSVSSGLAVELTKHVREVTDAPIVWGGIDTTVNPEWAIEHADIICVNEGEHASLELTQALETGRDISSIPNLWVKKNGAVIRNDIRPLIQDLDSLPYPNFDESTIWHIDHEQMRQGYLPDCSPLNPWYIVMTSRGCPYRCTFCIHGLGHEMAKGKGKYLRRRSVKNVIGELLEHKRRKPYTSQIMFYDDVFTYDRKWIAEFAAAYKKEIHIPFWVYTYPDMCDPEILRQLRDVGLIYVHMGIQSGSESVLRELYDRQMSPQKVLTAGKTLKDLGIFTIYDMLVGIPLETEEQLRESLRLILQIPEPFGLNVWPIIYYRNYKLTKDLHAADADDQVQHVKGTNASITPENTPYLRFWLSLLRLTRYPQIPREMFPTLLENEALRNDPTPLEMMERSLYKAVFVHNSEYLHKDIFIDQLQTANAQLLQEIEQLRNRKVMKLQNRIQQVLRWPQPAAIQAN
ncbi:MAG: radical SAM protein [Candidatus Omnitrophota bacterium]|jgi:radical SAM superfamily enzyme YgiQ (UPF0313 family)|nr:MAG: radical SAM protein [Candidatus Omnitrophota bacterium]